MPQLKAVLELLYIVFTHVALVSGLTALVVACAMSRPVPVPSLTCLSLAALFTGALLVAELYCQFTATRQVKPALVHLCMWLSLILTLASLLTPLEVDRPVRAFSLVSFLAYVAAALVYFVIPGHSADGQNKAPGCRGFAGDIFCLPTPSETQRGIPAYFECANEDPVCDLSSQVEPPKYSASVYDGTSQMEPPKYSAPVYDGTSQIELPRYSAPDPARSSLPPKYEEITI
ncbi:hypothetical protein RRG08_023400 [Elysia crispata]|uniref:Uncharacterized protein n=1 Tax=Elysia crispata TaxID=231223 RepID=A0AAE0YE56_9GAST|nr:hypothetical protein RRG08_023400 [Elysia crispata]